METPLIICATKFGSITKAIDIKQAFDIIINQYTYIYTTSHREKEYQSKFSPPTYTRQCSKLNSLWYIFSDFKVCDC